MNWNNVNTSNDIYKLMELFGDFHDSCISEINYVSGAFVDANLSMNAMDNNGILLIRFQRQSDNLREIEIEFQNLVRLNLIPHGENETCEIHGATFLMNDEDFYWGDSSQIIDFSTYNGTWLQSKKVRWRQIDN